MNPKLRALICYLPVMAMLSITASFAQYRHSRQASLDDALIAAIKAGKTNRALRHGAAIADGDRSQTQLSAVYCQAAEPGSLTICSTVNRRHKVLSHGSLYQIVADSVSRLAVLQASGAIVTYDRGNKTGIFYAKNPELIAWMADGLLYSSSDSVLLFDPKSGHSRAPGIDISARCIVVCKPYSYLVQAAADSTEVIRLAPDAKSKRICSLPGVASSSAFVVDDWHLMVIMSVTRNNTAENVFLVDLSSGSFRELLTSEPATSLCAGYRPNQLIWGKLDGARDQDGMALATDIMSIDLVTLRKTKLCRLRGQVSPVGAIRGTTAFAATQHVNAHGPGKLISFSSGTGKMTLLQRNVYNAFPAG